MTYKRFALGPSDRPPGDSSPPLALFHNDVAGGIAPATPNNFSITRA